ncbi:MAG: right-handed parallel beta-helix repeat-containing protein [Methylococcaceae bacterium]|nr:right-handed parallel beta-helix repeat-containing protein [Methylococcaceae bacterium]
MVIKQTMAITFGVLCMVNLSYAMPNDDSNVNGTNHACVHTGVGTDFPVGPGQLYPNISDVPWTTLLPGDTVRIFWRNTPYKEKIILGVDGTENNPIRVCGVPSPNGEQPILDGNGASNDIDDEAVYGRTTYNDQGQVRHSMESRAMITVYRKDYNSKPKNIIIEGLHIRNVRTDFPFIRMTGEQAQYSGGAACIRVQKGDNIVIRNNELENCGNGIFTSSQLYNEASLTRDILVEGNYLHDNGRQNNYLEHGMYIQAIGATIQNNRFGPNAQGTLGTTLKTRSAGLVIRNNFFEGGSARAMDLVEVEDAKEWVIEAAYRDWTERNGVAVNPSRLAKVKAAEIAYKQTYVYGNFINHVGSESDAASIIHFGADHIVPYPLERTLHLYNNTISVLSDLSDVYKFRLFIIGHKDIGSNETLEIFNNIIHIDSETPDAQPSFLCLGQGDGGAINFGVNWLTDSWNDSTALSACYNQYSPTPPLLTGVENLVGLTGGLSAPIDLSSLLPVTPDLNQAQVLPATVSAYPIIKQYEPHQKSVDRASMNTLGAAEFGTSGDDNDGGGDNNDGNIFEINGSVGAYLGFNLSEGTSDECRTGAPDYPRVTGLPTGMYYSGNCAIYGRPETTGTYRLEFPVANGVWLADLVVVEE